MDQVYDDDFWRVCFKHSRAWHKFNCENPKVWEEIVRYADTMRRKRKHYSIETIFHVIRYHRDIQTRGDIFKINNNHKAYYSRLYTCLRKCPDFFNVRGSNANDIDYEWYLRRYAWCNITQREE
jgi:hypothetical protein